jgi:F-type H+-transporting ATPase subunit alpha
VGGSAQTKAMKQVAGRLRLDLAQYNELAAFAQFGSDLDKSSKQQLARGERMVELLKQGQYQPLPFEKQVLMIFAGVNGYLDELPVSDIRRFEKEFLEYLDGQYSKTLAKLKKEKQMTEEITKELTTALEDFKKMFVM